MGLDKSKRGGEELKVVLDEMAKLAGGKEFLDCSSKQQQDMLTKISHGVEYPGTLEERFFVVMTQSTINGCYLSEVGIHQDLEYQGNTALAEFPGCTQAEHTIETKEGKQETGRDCQF